MSSVMATAVSDDSTTFRIYCPSRHLEVVELSMVNTPGGEPQITVVVYIPGGYFEERGSQTPFRIVPVDQGALLGLYFDGPATLTRSLGGLPSPVFESDSDGAAYCWIVNATESEPLVVTRLWYPHIHRLSALFEFHCAATEVAFAPDLHEGGVSWKSELEPNREYAVALWRAAQGAPAGISIVPATTSELRGHWPDWLE